MTRIPWATKAWNLWEGCTKHSAECANCYATRECNRLAGNPNPKVSGPCAGVVTDAETWTGRVNFVLERLDQPRQWHREERIFVGSRTDIFHEAIKLDHQLACFQRIFEHRQHRYLLLTKRVDRAVDVLRAIFRHFELVALPPHVWLGCTAGTQKNLDERAELLTTAFPTSNLFLSAEPLLEPIDVSRWLWRDPCLRTGRVTGGFRWVIAGAESGYKRRYVGLRAFEMLRDQCTANIPRIPYFLKQVHAGFDMDARPELVKEPTLGGVRWEQFPDEMLLERERSLG